MKVEKIELPFIEVDIINSFDSKYGILKQLEKRSLQTHHVRSSWSGTEENPILRIDYESKEHFIEGYTRDKLIYENFIKYINLQEISLTKNNSLKKPPEDEELYLIMKYRTNCKEPIRNNYSFTFKIIELLGIGASYEEVQDGFILFYRTKQDFLVGQMDLLNIDKAIEYLKVKGFYTPSIEIFFTKVKNNSFKDRENSDL
ncbi:MAG: hypothetical protein ACTSVZ_06430 [Promethearchaeota archaeon]